VKPANLDDSGTLVNFVPGGGLRVTNATLKDLIETAYQLRSFQILAGPSWIGVTRYDVTASSGARAEDATSATRTIPSDQQIQQSNDEVRKKVQALLKDRFQFKAHRETRELPMYSLVVAKNGIKTGSLRAMSNPRKGINARPGAMVGEAAPMAILASRLSSQLGRPVVNNTGLKENYDFDLQWVPDLGPAAQGAQTAADSAGPSIFTALQEQLGLRLEAIKGPVEVIVIDQVEKPSEN
jgi:uncharacterized protein (TIGR03435 family)